MKLELIQSVNPVVPTKGTNAGKQMFVINGKWWHNVEPKREETHVCLEDVEKEVEEGGQKVKKTYTNVVGYSVDTRQTIQEKIKMVTSYDAAYSMALASLLK
jgi:hypothetical protein